MLISGISGDKCKWGLYGNTVSIFPVVFQGIDRQTQCLAQVPQQGKSIALPLHAIETLVNAKRKVF